MNTESNVTVPESAFVALEAIRTRRGLRSRDRTVAALLGEYVEAQQDRDPPQRSMHVATLTRYPPPSREAGPGVDAGRPLRVRCDRRIWESACALGFRLPGQSRFRGHRDYQARAGTDAVLTAIARVEPLPDPVFGDHQILTHRQAHGLWRLVVEATRTPAEDDLRNSAAAARAWRETRCARGEPGAEDLLEVELIARRLEREVAWHGARRRQVAAAIVADRLTGPGATGFVALLDRHDHLDDEAWDDAVENARTGYALDPEDHTRPSWVGRGATAVWRAERAVRTEELLAWIRAGDRVSTPRTFVMRPPRWRLRCPSDWVPTPLATDPAPRRWLDHAAARRVLLIGHHDERFAWPTRVTADGATEPIPHFETILEQTSGRTVVEIVEITLIESPDEHSKPFHPLHAAVPAHVAADLGLITVEHRDRIVAGARAAAVDLASWGRPGLIDHDLLFAELAEKHPADHDRARARLEYARGPRRFLRYLDTLGARPLPSEEHFEWHRDDAAGHIWRAPALAALLAEDPDPAALAWLTAYRATLHTAVLHADANDRWLTAAGHTIEDRRTEQPAHTPTRLVPRLPPPLP